MVKTLRCIIIDDERNAIDSLNIILTEFIENIEVIGFAQNALDGVKLANKLNPDLVFLDVDMPEGSGFDFLEAFPEKKFKMIFTTASSNHAIKAVKARADDYLLKPIDVDELQNALNILFEELKVPEKIKGKIALPILGGFVYVNFSDIININGEGNYTTFYLKDNVKHLISKNLGHFTDKFQDFPFFKCHQSHIINLIEIKEINKSEGLYCVMSNNQKIDISRSNKYKLLELMKVE